MDRSIPVIIPSYEPDERLIELLHKLTREEVYVVIVNDGSGQEYKEIFDTAKDIVKDRGVVLHHEVNKGKGRALKTAFSYILDNIPEAIGVVTADSDGQHTPECIMKVSSVLRDNTNSLVLGVRSFEQDNIPWKSRFGNNLTLKFLKLCSGLEVKDTQTGLRGIPRDFIEYLLDVEGERFEYETRMLLESVNRFGILEVPIETIYDSKDNHQTHFNPVADSIKIYKILFERFIKYTFVSLSSFVIDIVLFSIFCFIFKALGIELYAALSTGCARVISAVYNYLMNYGFVFRSKENKIKAAGKYVVLAIIQMLTSAILITVAIMLFGDTSETIMKILIDTVLYVISYQIQKRLVF